MENMTTAQVVCHLNEIGIRCTKQWMETAIVEGNGPSYIQPSARKIYFLKEDIDAWRASWARVPAGQKVRA
jgi:hypothetical protein